jgi:hemerythrin superfamily protein
MADGFEVLTQDHRNVAQLFAEFESTGDDVIARRICDALVEHTYAEERALYPRLRAELSNGPELAEQAEEEHAAIEHLIARVLETPPPDLRPIMRAMREDVEAHVQEEEQQLFPAMREAGTDAEQLGAELEEAEEKFRLRVTAR